MKKLLSYDKFINEMAKDFMGVYKKRYNPEETGYGNADKWKQAFDERMDRDTAKTIIGKKDPFVVLGIPRNADKYEKKAAYRKLAMEFHPDKHPGEEEKYGEIFKEIQAAYELVRED